MTKEPEPILDAQGEPSAILAKGYVECIQDDNDRERVIDRGDLAALLDSHEALRRLCEERTAERDDLKTEALHWLREQRTAEARVTALTEALRRIVDETVQNDQFGYAITIARAALEADGAKRGKLEGHGL